MKKHFFGTLEKGVIRIPQKLNEIFQVIKGLGTWKRKMFNVD